MMQDFNQSYIQPYLSEFEAAYTNLGIGDYSESIAKDVINNGPGRITAAFNRHLNEQLDRDRVESGKLRAIHINRFYAEVYRFNKASDNLTRAINENK